MPTMFAPGLFRGHVAIVTGGGSGIGLAIAETLLELGAKVFIVGRDPGKLERAQERLSVYKGSLLAMPCDIREPPQIDAALSRLEGHFGAATVLINNAGGQFPTTAESVSPRGFEAVIRNNLLGTFSITQSVAVRMMIPHRRGAVVNITANELRGFPGMVHTGAARAAISNVTKTLAIEWANHRIRVNAVAPGIVRTRGLEQYPPELAEAARKRTPQKRLASAGEIAQLVAYLSSDAAAFVTGVTWYIDGGAHLWGDTWPIAEMEESAPQGILSDLAKLGDYFP